jgi:hypothetical protein
MSRLVLAPNGKVFYTGVGQMWGPFGQSVDEALFALQQFFDAATNSDGRQVTARRVRALVTFGPDAGRSEPGTRRPQG